ncbi:MAG: PAS domain-containing protein [Bacillota bacterium]|nr:PAS domain-containing protein [Bacillota bacterium]
MVHDLCKPETSIIYVAGNVTNRKIGGPVTNFVLEKLRNHSNSCEDLIGYKPM